MSETTAADEAALGRAEQLLESHRPGDAAALARELLNRTPDLVAAHSILARAASAGGAHEEAVEHALRMVELDPQGDETDATLVQILVPAGHAQEARKVAEQLVQRSPHFWGSHMLLAYARVNGAKPDTAGAVEAARAAVSLAPGEPEAHSYLGWCLARHGRPADARTSYEAALSIDPNNESALNNLGVLHLDHADLHKAGATLGSGLHASPTSPVLRRNMDEVVVRALGRFGAIQFLFAGMTGLLALAYDLSYGARLGIGVGLGALTGIEAWRVRKAVPARIGDWARAARERGDLVVLTLLGLIGSTTLCFVLVTFAPDPLVVPALVLLAVTWAVGLVFVALFWLRLIRPR
jgi:Flp pilus assembly protein TadD